MPSASLSSLPLPSPSHLPPVLRREPTRTDLMPASLLQPLARPAELAHAMSQELDAKRMRATQHRTLLKRAATSAVQLTHTRRREDAAALRAEQAVYTGKDTADMIKSVQPMAIAEVDEFAAKLNVAMCQIWPESRSQSSYFKLFRLADRNNSGLIEYYEFLKIVREVLRIPERKMSEAQVRSLWRWADMDGNGQIGAGEFLRLIRRGWKAFLKEQERLSKDTTNLLRRPNWNPGNNLPLDRPAWLKESATDLAARQKFYLHSATAEVLDRKRATEEAARRLEATEHEWTAKFEAAQRASQKKLQLPPP